MNEYNTIIASQTIKINGKEYGSDNIESILDRYTIDTKEYSFISDIVTFIKEWFGNNDTVLVHSSGSTGEPKPFYVEKKRMMNSACKTCSFLKLKKNDTALLCMHTKYIAGKMVIVRALVAGLNIIPVPPCGNPLASLGKAPDFAAMIPMQVYNSLKGENEKSLLEKIKNLIIGGGSIDNEISEKLKEFNNNVWSTYGMTETLSHIALRKLNGKNASDWYTPFEGVAINKNNEDTLEIYAPEICKEKLTTNDICQLNDKGQFKIIGRKDNVINSGGIKIQIEEVEALLVKEMPVSFMITSVPDVKFGEIVVMLIEDEFEKDSIMSLCHKNLSKYQIPKMIIKVDKLPLTETGKPRRQAAKDLACKSIH